MTSDHPYWPRNISRLSDFRARRRFTELLKGYFESLPATSLRYARIIFLYDEDLATSGRELLFDQLNHRADQFDQILVVTDVGFGRSGFYVNFDEIGATEDDPNYEALIENWNRSS
ncbi:hypothetical protein [Marinobacter salarius]|uniref:hypothetical protein n=1 Tax=Marinobacter salarius TaxID=1420917 RepID=UPI0018F151B4|nr:hypothetical protein [Marinobacter salarius]MBJ7302776.1 hypothetical protein [Marinobacter salarius]HIO29552.1 hypothetical protein [Marinobacter salarius]